MAERKSFVSEKVKERNKRNREKLKGLGKSILGAFSLDGLRGNKIKPFKKSEFSDEEILKEAKKISKERTEDRKKEGGNSEDLVGNKDIVQAKKNLKNNKKDTKKKEVKKDTKKKEVKKDTKSKKFDYKNKMKTQMSNAKGRRNARGRSSSEIANDPSFMKNTSKGKYLRGIHASLLRQGMASGGAVKKPSTKPSAGNKWN